MAEPSLPGSAATEPAAESREAAPVASATPPAEAVPETTPEPQTAPEDTRDVAETLRQAGSVGETAAPPANAPETPAQPVADDVASQHVPRVIEDSIEPAAPTPPPAVHKPMPALGHDSGKILAAARRAAASRRDH